jgi:hypothetical protein
MATHSALAVLALVSCVVLAAAFKEHDFKVWANDIQTDRCLQTLLSAFLVQDGCLNHVSPNNHLFPWLNAGLPCRQPALLRVVCDLGQLYCS